MVKFKMARTIDKKFDMEVTTIDHFADAKEGQVLKIKNRYERVIEASASSVVTESFEENRFSPNGWVNNYYNNLDVGNNLNPSSQERIYFSKLDLEFLPV